MKKTLTRILIFTVIGLAIAVIVTLSTHFYLKNTLQKRHNVNTIEKLFKLICVEYNEHILITEIDGFYNREKDYGQLIVVLEINKKYYDESEFFDASADMAGYDEIISNYGYERKDVNFVNRKFGYFAHLNSSIFDISVGRVPYSIRYYVMHPTSEKDTITVVVITEDGILYLKADVEQIMNEQELCKIELEPKGRNY